jgi:ubiquitin thioesterase OTU1
MRLRIRAPQGASTINLPDTATISDLNSQISEKTSISKFDIKYGYPPKPLLLQQYEPSRLLSELDVKLDGEQLIISPKTDETTSKGANQIEPAIKQTSHATKVQSSHPDPESFSFDGTPSSSSKTTGPVSLKRKTMEGEVPELPLPERGATLGMCLSSTTSPH